MFATLYKQFRKKPLCLILPLIAIFTAALYTAFNTRAVEDISEMLPMNPETKRADNIRQNIRLNDRLIVIISHKDSSEDNSRKLVEFADSLEKKIYAVFPNKLVGKEKKQFSEYQRQVYRIFYDNLPVFLNREDYAAIDSLMNDSAIQKIAEQSYKNLISPAGTFTKQYIRQDPAGLTFRALKRTEKLKPDENFSIIDNHIFAGEKSHLLLFFDIKNSETAAGQTSKIVKTVKKEIKHLQAENKGIQAQLFGSPVVASGNSQQIKTDIAVTVSLAVFMLMLFLSIFFRGPVVFPVIFLPAVFGATVSVALIHFIQGNISLISLGIGSILTGISIDYSLHILNHTRKEKSTENLFKAVSRPLLISSLSTATAFFVLLFVSSKALRDLGLFAGISVLAAAVFALLVLPHIAGKISGRAHKSKLTERIAAYNYHKSKAALTFIGLLTIAGILFAGKAGFEGDMDRMNYMSKETRAAQKTLNTISGLGYKTVYLAVEAPTLAEASAKQKIVGELLDSAAEQKITESYTSLHPVLIAPELQKKRIERFNRYFTPKKKTFLKEKLILYGKQYGFKADAFEPFFKHLDKAFKPMSTESEDFRILKNIFGQSLIQYKTDKVLLLSIVNVKEENKDELYELIKPREWLTIFDYKAFADKLIETLKDDFNRLVFISLSVVFLILLLYYGRIELAVISFTPLIISWLWTLGLMGLFNIKFTIFNIIISTFIFGLGIDYSVFIMQALLQQYRYGKNNLNVFKTSVLLSGITTITAIGVLIFAEHPALKSIAVLSIIGILSVIFAAYTLLPLMFRFLVYQQGKKRRRPMNAKDLFFSLAVITTLSAGSILSFIVELILRIVPADTKKKKYLFHRWVQASLAAIRYVPLNIRCRVHNPFKENFKKPAVIIANHQAHLDIALILMLHPKILIITNDWVQNNFFYGRIVKYADYLPASNGIEKNSRFLKEKIKNGYSLLIFPEGTRSKDKKIQRFHKGAFYYARKFGTDILPVILHGTGDCIPKGEPFLKSGQINLSIQKRINPEEYGQKLRDQAKNLRKLMREQYENMRRKYETPEYFKHQLIANYIYKGPILEHYTRVKIKSENYYRFFREQCPSSGQITDIGCGYGYMSQMLAYTSEDRKILGLDYDCDKIETARRNISKPENARFQCADVLEYNLPESDVFILADVLHYMPREKQETLIGKCRQKLKFDGKIIIRDGNSEMKKKHRTTRLSEFFSTRFLKFNKYKYGGLFFSSESEIRKTAEKYGMAIDIKDETKHTSNLIYILSQPKPQQNEL